MLDTPSRHSRDTASRILERWNRSLPELSSSAARLLSSESGPHDHAHRAANPPDKDRSGTLDVVDLFSGCGGFSAGFSAVNHLVPAFRLAQAVDIDPLANRTYEANLGLRPASLDIAQLAASPDRVHDHLPGLGTRPRIVVGGPPCQGFSSYRNAQGIKDVRNSLMAAFVRVAISLQSSAIVAENVPELLTGRYFGHVAAMRRELEASGYYVHVGVHNAADCLVPQERFRFLLVAMRHPFLPPAGPVQRDEYRTVRQAIGDLPPIEPGEHPKDDPLHRTARHRKSTVQTIRQVPLDGGTRPLGVGPESLRNAAARNGKPAYEDVYGRLYWDRPAITITAHSRNPASGRYVHPEQHRGLSIREAAALQGFPRNWILEGSLGAAFRQLGNAVPPPVGAAVATHILSQLANPVAHADFHPGIVEPIAESFSRLIPALKSGTRLVSDL